MFENRKVFQLAWERQAYSIDVLGLDGIKKNRKDFQLENCFYILATKGNVSTQRDQYP